MTLVLVLSGATIFFNSVLTGYVQSDDFRVELEKETAKGLHFQTAHYAPIRRTGILTAASDRCDARGGRKAMRTLEAREISAKFNPWGVFLRRWQLDELLARSGEVEIQKYEPVPEPKPAKPWYAIFLPKRVYLKQFETQKADVTWRFRGERAGFFGTQLFITPHGLDFNYQAKGGTLKMALIPDLYLRETRLLITKKLINLYLLDLAPDRDSKGLIHLQGRAGVGEDRGVDVASNFNGIPIRPWLPAGWKEYFSGEATGHVNWRGSDTKLETSMGDGSCRLLDAKAEHLSFLEKLVAITGKKSLATLKLNDCSFHCAWRYPKFTFENIAIEENGKFRIEGELSIDRGLLGGSLDLGVTREYLDWLPRPEEIFTRERDGYMWTRVHLSGTIDDPEQDLSPRIIEIFKESPGAYLKLLFRQLGAWLKGVLPE